MRVRWALRSMDLALVIAHKLLVGTSLCRMDGEQVIFWKVESLVEGTYIERDIYCRTHMLYDCFTDWTYLPTW